MTLTTNLFIKVRKYEKALIKRALLKANGSVTSAARALDIDHQTLAYIINHRHKDLIPYRKPIKPRRKSLITIK